MNMIYCGRLPQIAESAEAKESDDRGDDQSAVQQCRASDTNFTSHRGQDLLIEL